MGLCRTSTNIYLWISYQLPSLQAMVNLYLTDHLEQLVLDKILVKFGKERKCMEKTAMKNDCN
jgi:hypothetical protein